MTRLIDADALIKTAIKPARPGTFNVKYNYSEMRTRFLRFIDNQPTVDAIPIEFIRERMEGYYKNSYTELGACLETLIEDWRK